MCSRHHDVYTSPFPAVSEHIKSYTTASVYEYIMASVRSWVLVHFLVVWVCVLLINNVKARNIDYGEVHNSFRISTQHKFMEFFLRSLLHIVSITELNW